MKIRMLTTAAGPEGSFIAGKPYDLPDALAQKFLAARAAVEYVGPIVADKKDDDEDEPEDQPIAAAERADARPTFKHRKWMKRGH
jgi:hypothetical protein